MSTEQPSPDARPSLSEAMGDLRAALREVVVPPLDRLVGWLNRVIERSGS